MTRVVYATLTMYIGRRLRGGESPYGPSARSFAVPVLRYAAGLPEISIPAEAIRSKHIDGAPPLDRVAIRLERRSYINIYHC